MEARRHGGVVGSADVVGNTEGRRGNVPAASLALCAMSSSSRSWAFFLGFLLWIGFVPAAGFSQRAVVRLADTARVGSVAESSKEWESAYLLVRKASWR